MVVCELVKAMAIPPPEDMSMPDMLLSEEEDDMEVGIEAMLMEVVVDIDDMSIFGENVLMWLVCSWRYTEASLPI